MITPTSDLELTGSPVPQTERLTSRDHLRHRLPSLIPIPRIAGWLLVLDGAAVVLAMWVAVLVRFGSLRNVDRWGGLPYELLISMIPLVWLAAMALGGCYDRRWLVCGVDEYRRVLTSGLVLFAAVACSAYLTKTDLSRSLVVLAVPLVIATTLVERYTARKLLHRALARGRTIHRVVVVGSQEEVRDLTRHLRRARWAGWGVVGACVPGRVKSIDIPDDEPLPVLGPVRGVIDSVRLVGADTLAVAGSSAFPNGSLRRLSWELEGTGIHLVVVPAITDIAGPRILVRPLDGLPLLHIEEPTLSGVQWLIKGLIDRILALALIVVLSPLLLAIAVAVRTTSRGGVFFKQERIGRFGRPFIMWKFRTMTAGAERERDAVAHLDEHDGPLFKIHDDPRITPLGRRLRRFSLDELPQLWNILNGTMSMVGPRPPLASETDEYEVEVHRRLLVRPGITGLWQTGGRADLPWAEAVRLDLQYVENWSPAMDTMVMWKTIITVLRGDGAY